MIGRIFMTQHSNDTILANLQTGASGFSTQASRWVVPLSSTKSLLSHAGVLLAITASLTMLNLVVNPEALWSRAILVIWLVVIVAHAIGIVILRLLNDDAGVASQLPRIQAEPSSPWTQPNGQPSAGMTARDDDTENTGRVDPWKDVAAPVGESEVSWPSSSTATTELEQAPAEIGTRRNGASDDANQKVPWRAATEIAWLRKPRDADHPETGQRDSGS